MHTQHTAQAAACIGDVKILDMVIDILLPIGLQIRMDVLNLLVNQVVEVLRDHQAAGRIRGILEELAGLLSLFGGHFINDRLNVLVIKLAQEVSDMITVQLAEDGRRVPGRKFLDQVDGLGVGDILDNLRGINRIEHGE